MKQVELDTLKKIIDQHQVVSFDIFDTLLLRNVQRPVDIFRILEKEVKQKYHLDNFFNIRVESEKNSRNLENHYETTLDEIYSNMINIDEQVRNEIKEIELELEYNFLAQNPFMFQIYEYCLKNNKKIICISDMYLPEKFLSKVLEKNGYKNMKIYLSCTYLKSKENGSLYDYVMIAEKINKKEWLHIGDNYESDYNKAKAFGIDAYHYVKVLERSNLNNDNTSISNSIISAINNNIVNNGLDISYWAKFGILYASPIYFSFSNFLIDSISSKEDTYYFFDNSFIIKEILDLIIKRNKLKIGAKCLYLKEQTNQVSNASKNRKSLEKSPEILTKYFIQEGINKSKRIKIVDTGLTDNNQYLMSTIIDNDIMGYYFGTNASVHKNTFYNTKGFVIDHEEPKNLANEIIKNSCLYDFIFSPAKSLNHYEEKNNKIIAILKDNKSSLKEVREIQNKAISVIEKYLDYYQYTKDLSSEECIESYRSFIEKKKYHDLVHFSKLNTNNNINGEISSFVPIYSRKEIEELKNKFPSIISKSPWPNAFLVKDISDPEEYEAYKNTLFIKYGLLKKQNKVISTHNLKYLLKHPKRAISKVHNKLFKKKKI